MRNLVVLFASIFFGYSTFSQSNTNSKFDFISGEKVIFFDDFTNENLGDFPANWNTNGSGEIVNSDKFESRWLKLTKQGFFIPELSEDFTENYTIEFDLISEKPFDGDIFSLDMYLLSGDLMNPKGGTQPGEAGFRIHPSNSSITWNNWSEAREWQGDEGFVDFAFKSGEINHFAFWFQKQRVRLYINNTKVLDLQRGLNKGYKYNIFRIDSNSDDLTPLIGNYRMAAGLPDVRSKLLTEGKLISYGIYFDVNSDKIKEESMPAIKEIASVLSENKEIKIKIIGHTDADGNEASNLKLSENRSNAVKAVLNKTFGIDNARIETEGKGESQPLAPNDNAINKAKNRRVEFVKL